MTAPRHPPADHSAALEQYRQRAGIYDAELALFEPIRRRAIERLALHAGDVVLDVGCGTGLSLALLQQGIGAGGRIVGIEQCPEMIELARQRVAQQAWSNVRLLTASAQTARIAGLADAALFHFTHDILRAPQALAHVLRHLRPGARVVATGLQWALPWAWPVNLFVWPAALHSVTSLEGLTRPWSHLEALLDIQRVETMLLGGVFVVSGAVRHRPDPQHKKPRRESAHEDS
jgi:SAM-dependent methyltransferase